MPLKNSISHGVLVTKEASSIAVANGLKELQGKLRRELQGFDFSQFEDLNAAITAVFFHGSSIQQKAFSNSFSVDACLNMPQISTLLDANYPMVLAIIVEHLHQVATFFGKESFLGSSEDCSSVLLSTYEHWSLLDFMKFFADIRAGKYKNQFESVSMRGLNSEFIMDWAKRYEDDRNAAYEHSIMVDRSMRKNSNSFLVEGLSQNDKKAFIAKKVAFEQKKKYAQELYNKIIENYKPQTPSESLMSEIDLQIVDVLGSGNAQKISSSLIGKWKSYYLEHQKHLVKKDGDGNDVQIDLDTFMSMQVSDFLSRFVYNYKRFSRKTPQEYFIDSIMQLKKDCKTLNEFIFKLSGKQTNFADDDNRFLEAARAYAKNTIERIEKSYLDYQIKSLESGIIPEQPQQYLFRNIRKGCARKFGIDYAPEVLRSFGIEI